MSRTASTLSSFIADAPPGEVHTIRNNIEELVEGNSALLTGLTKDIVQYDIKQLSIAKGRKTVLSEYNQLADGRFYDTLVNESFVYDHINGVVSDVEPYSPNIDVDALNKAVGGYVAEHYPSKSGYGVYPQSDGTIAIVLVDSQYSPSNFWSGRWKAWYFVSGQDIKGKVELDIHYYEDGNVRFKTSNDVSGTATGPNAAAVVAKIGELEDAYQDGINKTFLGLNEGPFKSLRRQLPVTRSKMDWENAANYKIGQDISGFER